MKILVTGGTGLVGNAIKSIKDKYSEHTFIFSSRLNCDLINYFDIYKRHLRHHNEEKYYLYIMSQVA